MQLMRGPLNNIHLRRVSWWIRWWPTDDNASCYGNNVGVLAWSESKDAVWVVASKMLTCEFVIPDLHQRDINPLRPAETANKLHRGARRRLRLLCKPNKLCCRHFHILFWRCWESEFGSPAFKLSNDVSLLNSHWHCDAMPSVDLQIVSFDGLCGYLRNLIGVVVLAGWIINERELWGYPIDEIVKESMYGSA